MSEARPYLSDSSNALEVYSVFTIGRNGELIRFRRNSRVGENICAYLVVTVDKLHST